MNETASNARIPIRSFADVLANALPKPPDDGSREEKKKSDTAQRPQLVRSGEEEGFDYEKLLRFTYHNVHTGESFDLVDKYVKGQEFPIVVVEGFPAAADRAEFAETMDDAERQMWRARRQLYLCCSRSMAFLYFVVPNPEGGNFKGLAAEILDLVRQVSTPEDPATTTNRIWRLNFERTNASRPPDDFLWEGTITQPQEQPQVQANAEANIGISLHPLGAGKRISEEQPRIPHGVVAANRKK